jgi:hypothetical protein
MRGCQIGTKCPILHAKLGPSVSWLVPVMMEPLLGCTGSRRERWRLSVCQAGKPAALPRAVSGRGGAGIHGPAGTVISAMHR